MRMRTAGVIATICQEGWASQRRRCSAKRASPSGDVAATSVRTSGKGFGEGSRMPAAAAAAAADPAAPPDPTPAPPRPPPLPASPRRPPPPRAPLVAYARAAESSAYELKAGCCCCFPSTNPGPLALLPREKKAVDRGMVCRPAPPGVRNDGCTGCESAEVLICGRPMYSAEGRVRAGRRMVMEVGCRKGGNNAAERKMRSVWMRYSYASMASVRLKRSVSACRRCVWTRSMSVNGRARERGA